jgi:hypothetical protein
MRTLYAPELRDDDGSRDLTRTQATRRQACILIGSAHVRPAPMPTDDAERLQRALLGRPKPIRLYTNPVVRAVRWLLNAKG